MTKQNDKVWEMLVKHFGFEDTDGTYLHMLTRVKSAYKVGTISIDDFEELSPEDDFVVELFQAIHELMSEQKRLILEEGEKLKISDEELMKLINPTNSGSGAGINNPPKTMAGIVNERDSRNQALTDYQERIKQMEPRESNE